MPYYNICALCGATLDPGEKCTCREEKAEEEENKKFKEMVDFTARILKKAKRKKK